ncbi:late embryogenesis abundant protein At1g64065-like [Durio zibethinus]|uniref:Late embryogenesis abundant protein At1g64065-like n=1 Tax=Durio zibethinus TaxID=66656 RepID=A0A6P5YAV8_DURZI|nr:late embryogenesis abundant protein At1g64065-like [Durio zibethinus]
MAEKSESPYPLVAGNGYLRSDGETVVAPDSKELKKKKRMKCLLYIVLFAVFQTGIILLFALTVMRIRNPKFRVRSGSFVDIFNVGTEASPSFDLRMNTQFTVKNTNFGHFKYELGTVTFAYRGTPVGQATIHKARTRARSTKKVDVVVELRSSSLSNTIELGRDISSGVLPLTSYSKLDGKIHLMKVIKRKKSAQMNCTMEINIALRTLGNIMCN